MPSVDSEERVGSGCQRAIFTGNIFSKDFPSTGVSDLKMITGHVVLLTLYSSEEFDVAEEHGFFAQVDDDRLVDWFRSGHRALVEALAGADPAVRCWSFLPAPSPLAFWARRQAHETAVHRADVESAIGSTPAWAPAFAVDGIEELLRAFFARRPERITSEPPVAVALSATDAEAAWTIRMDAGGLRVADGAEPATLALSGTASDLYLLLWNRIGLDGFAADGDPGALEAWRSKAAVTWS